MDPIYIKFICHILYNFNGEESTIERGFNTLFMTQARKTWVFH